MRFSIRDLLWVMLVVAMGLGWWMSYRASDAKRLEAVAQAHRLWYELDMAKDSYVLFGRDIDELNEEKKGPPLAGWHLFGRVNWSILDEPLIEP